MQLVVASDTTNPEKPIPVAVAWVYIGKDNRMVIDNIEANNAYVGKFNNQFTEQMRNYMDNYAKACGFKLVQGTSNNDIVVADEGNGTRKTFYNRPVARQEKKPYYLEAEYE
jgi:hypothetical protein